MHRSNGPASTVTPPLTLVHGAFLRPISILRGLLVPLDIWYRACTRADCVTPRQDREKGSHLQVGQQPPQYLMQFASEGLVGITHRNGDDFHYLGVMSCALGSDPINS